MNPQIESGLSRYKHWLPVVLAPLVVGLYYLSLRNSFAQSIEYVVKNASDVDPLQVNAPHWGSHWIYRLFAEAVSLSYAIFVTAGLSRRKPRQAALVAALTVSVAYAAWLGIVLWALFSHRVSQRELMEPWYQYIIDSAVMIAAPFMATPISEVAHDVNAEAEQERGFGGIARAHFLWLWILFYWYGLGLISPVMNFYIHQDPNGFLSNIIGLVAYGIPSAALLLPLFYGLAFLSGHNGARLQPVMRNLAGIAILVGGLIAGSIVQYGWGALIRAILGH